MIIKEFPVLYAKSSKGKIKQWAIKVEKNDGVVQIVRLSGYVDGKQARSVRDITEGVNIGKSNETTIEEQAILKAESKYKKKQDDAYVEDQSQLKEQVTKLPMLALKYESRKKDINFPCYVQPKLDGIRCIVEIKLDKAIYTSRKEKQFTTLDHMSEDIRALAKSIDAPLDGEIYLHEEMTFQEITSAVKKQRPETLKLKYHIYDIMDEGSPFHERNNRLAKAFAKLSLPALVLVPTYMVEDEEQIRGFHELFVKDGYEGVIVRNMGGVYKKKHRSKDLQKWKFFQDEEFEIVGGKEAQGEDRGTIVFRCVTSNGDEFDVRPRGSREQRRKWLKDIKNLIGEDLIVRYQNMSDDSIPRFPVGIGIRDVE